MKTLEAEEEVLQLQWDLAMKEKEAELAEKDLEISMHQDNVEHLTDSRHFWLTTPKPMVITCLACDKANNIAYLGSLVQKEEVQRVKGPGDI